MSSRGVSVLVKVLSVHRNYAFPCCIRCSRRIRSEDDENIFSCRKCHQKYDKKDISYRYRANMTVSDRTKILYVTIFGKCLEDFFGTSATCFNRFVDSIYLEYEELPLPVDEIVHQCIEQCFIGSVVGLWFRGLQPSCPTDSQISRSSPTYLKNILSKLQGAETNCFPKQRQDLSCLLPSYMSRAEGTERKATVLEILKEYLEFFRCSENVTPPCNYTTRTALLSSTSHSQEIIPLQIFSEMNSSGLNKKCPTSCDHHSNVQHSWVISPLILQFGRDGLNCQFAKDISVVDSNNGLEIDSQANSQTRERNTPGLNSSPNKTALVLVNLLNVEQSDYSTDELKNKYVNKLDGIHEDNWGSSWDNSTADESKETRNISHNKNDCENETTHVEDLGYLNNESFGKGKITENESQRMQCTSSGRNGNQVKNDKNDKDFSQTEDLNNIFANLNIDSHCKRIKDTDEMFKREDSANAHKPLCGTFCGPGDQQDNLAIGCDSLQEQTDRMDTHQEDVIDSFLIDLKLSHFSFPDDLQTFPEAHLGSKTPPMTSSQEFTKKVENQKNFCKNVIENSVEKTYDIQEREKTNGSYLSRASEQNFLLEDSFYADEVTDSLLQKVCAKNYGSEINDANKESSSSSTKNKRTANEVFVDLMVNTPSGQHTIKEQQTTHRHDTYIPKKKYTEIPGGITTERKMGKVGQNGDFFVGYSVPCMYSRNKRSAASCQEKLFAEYNLQNVTTSKGLMLESLVDSPNKDGLSSTPVLFDDSGDSTGNNLKLCLSLSGPEMFHPEDVMERVINMNFHSTPLPNKCEKQFKELSGDLQNYSGLFVEGLEKYICLDTNVVSSAKAVREGVINCDEGYLKIGKCFGNEESFEEFTDTRRQGGMEVCREDKYGTNYVMNGVGFGVEITPGQGKEKWHKGEQICPDTPIPLSCSSIASNSCSELTPDGQQDSLLCASLLECSYLK